MDLITRVRTPALHDRLIASAKRTADKPFEFHSELDTENVPKIAETYNRLAESSKSDILCFVHDDIEFISDGWDTTIEDLFAEYDADIIGVVGANKYEGGRVFDAGWEHSLGHFMCELNGVPTIKVLSRFHRYVPAKVVDGMLMFARKDYWEMNKFDLAFDELYFYDTDFCLRGKVGIACGITVKHSKPKELYGVYPEGIKPITFYEPLLNEKHGFTKKASGPQGCAAVLPDDFKKMGMTYVFDQFQKKREQQCVSR